MEKEIAVLLGVLCGVLYVLFGFGFYRLDRKATGKVPSPMVDLFLWPIGLLVYALTDEGD